MNYAFILMHGWGSNGDYWQNLVNHLDGNDYFIYEQGYFSNKEHSKLEDVHHFVENHPNDKIVGIGHSIGFIKLLETNVEFDYIFGLQSFVNFLGSGSTLKILSNNFQNFVSEFLKNPGEMLKNSYISARIYEYFEEGMFGENNINYSLLIDDLQSLKEDKSHLLGNNDINYHIFGSHDDSVVHPFIIKDNFFEENITFLDVKAYHSLGIFHSELVAKEIFDKLAELEKNND